MTPAEKREKALIEMAKCLFGVTTDPNVTVSPSTRLGLREAHAVIGGVPTKLTEQNLSSGSFYAQYARAGVKIAWVFNEHGGYTGEVVLKANGEWLAVYKEGVAGLLRSTYG